MDHPQPGRPDLPGAGRDRLIWVASPKPQRPRAVPERELLGGLDLDAVPASVTPPRTWRQAAAFSVAASAAVLMALSIVALAVVGPARLALPLHKEPGEAKVVVEPDATTPDTTTSAAGATAHRHTARPAGAGVVVDAGGQGGRGHYPNTGDASAAGDVGGSGDASAAGNVGDTSLAGGVRPIDWSATADAQPAETGEVTEPGDATEIGLTQEPGAAPETGGMQHCVGGEAGKAVLSAARTARDGHGFLVGLTGEHVPVTGAALPEQSDAAGFEQARPQSGTPPVPPDIPDTATSAARGVSHWISVDPLGNADRRQ